jgi:DNA-binding CsgD family transcriptional regulator
MADKMSNNPLAQSLLIFLICAVGIAAFLLLIVLPSQKTSAEMDQEIDILQARIEEQRILTPVFHSLLKRAKTAPPSALPSPKKTKLTHRDMNTISKVFQDIAVRHNLNLEEVKTDVSSMMQDSGYLMMRLRLSGNFYKFREFLVDLESVPSLEHIEEINIRPVKTDRELEIKLWLGQE